MDIAQNHRMTADEFIAWAMEQPEGKRYELVGGEVIQMASQRVGHALVKGCVFRCLGDAVEEAGLRCQTFPDGMAVRVDDHTVYEPDAAVRCGEPLASDAIEYNDPIVVVEVLSPSTQAIDTQVKLVDYFRLRSVRHYLVVHIARRVVIHHRWTGENAVTTAIVTGELVLDPPGLRLDVSSFFPSEPLG